MPPIVTPLVEITPSQKRKKKRRRRKKGEPLTEKGKRLLEEYRRRIRPCTGKQDFSDILGRKKETINGWAELAKKVCPDFAKCEILLRRKFGYHVPWHPFQVYVLTEIDVFQGKNESNPSEKETKKKIKAFVKSQNYTLENFAKESAIFVTLTPN